MENYCTEIDSYLGNGDSRYFSQGFKHFGFDLHTVKLMENGFTSSIVASYKGPDRPRQENPHLGSMEYSSIALYLAEVHLVKIWPIEHGTMYSRSYRERDTEISKIEIDEIQEQISGTVKVTQSLFQELNGLGTSFDHIILTDLIGITGQLMQVLLFTLLRTEREKCPNIWLRSMDIKFERPERRENYRAMVNLSDRKMLKLGEHTYHSFSVISRIGNMDARFNVCHKIGYL